MPISLSVTPLKFSGKLARDNFLGVSIFDFGHLLLEGGWQVPVALATSRGVPVTVKGKYFLVKPSMLIAEGQVYFNLACRQTAMVPFHEVVELTPIRAINMFTPASNIALNVKPFRSDAPMPNCTASSIEATFKGIFTGHFVNIGQVFYFNHVDPATKVKVALSATVDWCLSPGICLHAFTEVRLSNKHRALL
jgi:hypothetical protein